MPNHILPLHIQCTLVRVPNCRVRDHNIQVASGFPDHLCRREVVLLIRRDEGHDVHFARVRGGQLSEVRHGGGIARASEDDGVWLCGEGGDKGEA